MRIWDINPGYLNDRSLLGEHAELHGLVAIITDNKKGYYNHPETQRWIRYPWAINKRHELLVSEMELRGFNHKSCISININEKIWPNEYLDMPQKQFDILSKKYKNKDSGRIPLPISAQHIWRQHKYSVMARDYNQYKRIGDYVSKTRPNQCFSELTKQLIELLRTKPSAGAIRNSLQHMWGYFKRNEINKINVESLELNSLLLIIQELAVKKREKYILESTALSDFKVWI